MSQKKEKKKTLKKNLASLQNQTQDLSSLNLPCHGGQAQTESDSLFSVYILSGRCLPHCSQIIFSDMRYSYTFGCSCSFPLCDVISSPACLSFFSFAIFHAFLKETFNAAAYFCVLSMKAYVLCRGKNVTCLVFSLCLNDNAFFSCSRYFHLFSSVSSQRNKFCFYLSSLSIMFQTHTWLSGKCMFSEFLLV